MYHVRVKEALRRSEYGQLELERLVIRREIFRVESVRTVRGRKEEGERERNEEGRRTLLLALSAIQSSEDVVGTYKSLPGFAGPSTGTAVTRYPNDV